MSEKKKVLFVCYGGGHVNMVIPVYNALKDDPDLELTILGLTSAQITLGKHEIPHLTYRDLLEDTDNEALAHGERLVQGLPKGGMIPVEESIAYMGLSYWDLEQRHGKEEAEKLFAELDRHAFLQLSILERCIKKVGADLVVATNSPKSEKASLLKARELGIPAVCIIDLFGEKEFTDRLAKKGYADKLCVFGDFVKKRLLELGRKESEVEVTGNAAFDYLADLASDSDVEAFKDSKGWSGQRNILWIRTHTEEYQKVSDMIENELFRLAESHPEWQIIVRPHPNEDWSRKDLPSNVSVSPRTDELRLVLQSSDVVLSLYSTVVLEAALIKKPVFQLNIPEHLPPVDYTGINIALSIDNIESIESSIQEALTSPRSIADLPAPGQAAMRVADVIRGLLQAT